MPPRSRVATILVGTVLIPMVLQIVLMASAKALHSSVPWYGNFLSQTLGAAFGVAVLIYRFRWRGLVASVVYAPVAFGSLILFTLFWGALIYGDSL